MRHTVSVAAICVALLMSALWPRVVLSHETLTTTVLFDREIVRVLTPAASCATRREDHPFLSKPMSKHG